MSNNFLKLGRDIVQLEGSKTNYQKSVGISHNFQLSQEKSQMSSQSSVLRFMSQPGREDEDSWCFTDNEIDSRKSSQTLEKPHISRGITRPGPDLVRSDSDLMCSPRFKTQTYDTALSPRKNPRKGKERNRMPAYDDKNPDYDREEKERRKSLSTLSLSTKKSSANFWRENSTSRKQCKNEVGFNAPIDSQKSNLSEESSNSFVSLNRLQRDFGLSNEEIGSQKFKQEIKAYPLEQTVLEDENLKKFSQAISQDPEKQKYSDLRTKVEESSKLTRKDHVLKMNNFDLNSRKEDNNAPNRYPETNKKLNDMEKYRKDFFIIYIY